MKYFFKTRLGNTRFQLADGSVLFKDVSAQNLPLMHVEKLSYAVRLKRCSVSVRWLPLRVWP